MSSIIGAMQIWVFLTMLIIGAFSILAFSDRPRKTWLIAGAVWTVIFCLLPLAIFWIKGVFG